MIYSRIARVTVATAAVGFVLTLFGERDFEHYNSIIDRHMFGMPPPGFDPTKPPSEVTAKGERAKEAELTKEQEQLKSNIHFSVINVTPAGDTAVGFTDNSDSKNPKHYYLKVGESRDGWTVKEADPLKAEMTIAKGEVEVTLTIGGNSATGGGTTKKAGGMSPAANLNQGGGRSNLLGGRMGLANGGASRGLGSMRERRALREQQKAAEKAEEEEKERRRAAERAAEKAEREAEKAEREKEREEQRAQLLEIQEELKKAREEKEKAKEAEKEKGEGEEQEAEE